MGAITPLLPQDWVIYDFDRKESALFFIASKGNISNQVYKINWEENFGQVKKITALNQDITSKIKTSSRIINYASYDGTMIQGILTLPPSYTSSQKYPLIVIITAGPLLFFR